MKSLIFIGLTIFANMSFAQSLDWGTYVEHVAGEVVKVEPLCPEGVNCVTNGTSLTLRFYLNNGCGQLLPLEQRISKDLQTLEVRAQAQYPLFAMCTFAIVEEEVTLTLINVYPPFQVSFVETDVLVDVEKM